MINLCVQLLGTCATIFAYCEFGERVGMAFDGINIAIEQLKWYLLPQKTRKMLLNILIVAQEPIDFTILGSIACNRKTFKEASSIRLLQNTKKSRLRLTHDHIVNVFMDFFLM